MCWQSRPRIVSNSLKICENCWKLNKKKQYQCCLKFDTRMLNEIPFSSVSLLGQWRFTLLMIIYLFPNSIAQLWNRCSGKHLWQKLHTPHDWLWLMSPILLSLSPTVLPTLAVIKTRSPTNPILNNASCFEMCESLVIANWFLCQFWIHMWGPSPTNLQHQSLSNHLPCHPQ
jgi:hypothetical protein